MIASWVRRRRSDREAEDKLPERVQAAIRRQEVESQRLISLFQLGVVLFFMLLAAIQPDQPVAVRDPDIVDPVPIALGGYALFTLVRLYLSWRERLVPWVLYLSIVVDMALLLALIWSFHIEYGQPPSFYLKAPTMIYVFIFIGLRVMSFRAPLRGGGRGHGRRRLGDAHRVCRLRFRRPRDDHPGLRRVHDLQLGSHRGRGGQDHRRSRGDRGSRGGDEPGPAPRRALRHRERGGARPRSLLLARGRPPDHTASEQTIEAGSGKACDAAIVFCDIRGFTRFSHTVSPGEVIAMLTDYQHALVPAIQTHGGTIDKFMGDGIMATFGAVRPSGTAAADALRAVDAVMEAAGGWNRRRAAEGRPVHRVNAAAAFGPIVFGAVGDRDRLEYTVIGDPVNQAAKLEKANRTQAVDALTDRGTFEAAVRQGYEGGSVEHRSGSRLEGFDEPVDLVVLAPRSSSPSSPPR